MWRGRDERLDRQVAIKRIELPPAVSEEDREEVRRRVLREARAAAQLNHRAVTTVHDVLEQDGTAYLVMELIDAPDLTRIVEESGPLSPEEAAGLALPILDALAAAHRRGITHRDVKPSNVLVSADGPPKLTDFGIASVTDDPNLTSTGIVLGSPAYMAPEQARGERAGAPADLWGLGATLYYAVEGRPPFERSSAVATVHSVVSEPHRPTERAGGLREAIDALLTKSPDQRPSIEDLRERLTAVRDGTVASAVGGDATTRRMRERPEDATTGGDPAATQEAAAATADDGAGDPATRPVQDEPPTRTVTEDDRSKVAAASKLAGLLAGTAALALVGAIAVVALTDGPSAEEDTAAEQQVAEPEATSSPADEDTGEPEANPRGTGAEDQGAEGSTAAEDAQVPGSWERSSPEGHPYTVAHPPGWEARRGQGNNVDLHDPSSGAYLRVAWTDDPNEDPVADRREYSRSFAESHEDYRELALEPTGFRGHDAALWEYTYREGGAELHAIQLSWVADGRGYALNYQTPAEEWEELSDLWPQLTSGFEVTDRPD